MSPVYLQILPLEETISITSDTIFETYPNIEVTRKEFQKLLKTVIS